MKLPRNLSGKKLAQVLIKHFSYLLVHQSGSHMILDTKEPTAQRVAIPAHKFLKVGTLNSILRSVASHKEISREEILKQL